MALSTSLSSSVEEHSDNNIRLTVEQQPIDGAYWLSIKLIARVPLPPEEVFEILTDPENHKYFRSVKGNKRRKVIFDDGHGRRKVEVDQIGRWRFGLFRGSFSIKLVVATDKRHRTIGFELAPKARGGFMKDFNGNWKVLPYSKDAVNEMEPALDKHWSPLHAVQKTFHQLEETLTGKHPNSSLVMLRQSVAPALIPPAPLDKIIKKITAAQVRTIMEDLLIEANRRNALREKEERKKIDENALESHTRAL